jgi:hypothetical protein
MLLELLWIVAVSVLVDLLVSLDLAPALTAAALMMFCWM